MECYLWLPISDMGLHKLQQAGSLDRYILCSSKRQLQSRLGEKLRYRLMRVLEMKEEEMMVRALQGDTYALPIAYDVVMRQERDERRALRGRNFFLFKQEGKSLNTSKRVMHRLLREGVSQVKSGQLVQDKFPERPRKPMLYQEMIPIFQRSQRRMRLAVE